MMIENSGASIESASVPGIAKSEPLKVQMMAELMAQRAEERSERGDFFSNSRSHPHANYHAGRMIVAEKLGC